MLGNKIPDFNLLPWRKNRTADLAAVDGTIVGEYAVYINERTGDSGVRIEIDAAGYPVLAWEKALIYGGKEIKIRYVAHREDGVWRLIRVKNNYPVRVIREVSLSGIKVTMYFDLVIKGEADISVLMRL